MNSQRPFSSRRFYSLNLLLIFFCLAYFPVSHGPLLADLSEIAIPIGVSLGLLMYSLHVLTGNVDVERSERIALYGWVGAVIASFGSGWFIHQLQRELAVTLLLDEALTVVSVGSVIGVFVGAHVAHERRVPDQTDRDRLLSETVWTNKSHPNPILTAITTEIAELEGVEPLELDPLYDHMNPDIFTDLRAQDDSHWQLLFYTDEYEIRVSSQGTVSMYDTTAPNDGYSVSTSPMEQW